MPLLHNFFKNIFAIYKTKYLLWQILAIIITAIVTTTGLDWTWHTAFHDTAVYNIFFPGAGLLGFFIPVIIPFGLLLTATLSNNPTLKNTAWALGQAAILGFLISSFYKIFTGRPGPEIGINAVLVDTSHIFRFGFWRGGIFWGWPSSHTSVAIAMTVTAIKLHPKNKTVIILALLYGCYIAFGASISFHWLSDVIAGTILGTLIGLSVSQSFQTNKN